MDRKSKILLMILVLAFVIVIIASYYNIFIRNEYMVTKQIPCDPEVNSCFVSDCESNDSTCDQTTTYMKISAPSKYAGSDYDNFSCSEGDSRCQIIICNENTVEDGEKCFE